ncbi:unnamed protein product [Cuscuta campestris]|uniref:Reverse transcriptase domain-containing protein n=1 Tax=Cuscuta campestris TaxID=132261 RepID=A0A484KMW4_9ASTE|nr:unnamed protein product [Cuscuta campestris]
MKPAISAETFAPGIAGRESGPAIEDFTTCRPQLARCCVEVDISHLPPAKIHVQHGEEDMLLDFYYENVPSYCMDCGKIGHPKKRCPLGQNRQDVRPKDVKTDTAWQVVTRKKGKVKMVKKPEMVWKAKPYQTSMHLVQWSEGPSESSRVKEDCLEIIPYEGCLEELPEDAEPDVGFYMDGDDIDSVCHYLEEFPSLASPSPDLVVSSKLSKSSKPRERSHAMDYYLSLHTVNEKSQILTCGFKHAASSSSVWISSVYGLHTTSDREDLWMSLRTLFPRSGPWIVGGDFNTLASLSEHKGAVCPDFGGIGDFAQVISECELVAPHFLGSEFIWTVSKAEERLLRAEDTLERDDCEENVVACNLARPLLQQAHKKEEMFWSQKENARWISQGDASTAFFHSLVKGRINRLFISSLKNTVGCMLSSQERIAKEVVAHFTRVFSTVHEGDMGEVLSHIPSLLSEQDNDMLGRLPDEKEVRKTIWALNANSAAGADGFNGFFFRQILSRILSDRLKRVLPTLISPEQAAFQQGKSINKHVLMVKEMVHFLSANTRGGNCIIKLDLSKAFDNISWSYLEQVLIKFGFSPRIMQLLMGNLRSTFFSVLVNGQSKGFFPMQCGVKQGDPLSPLLFILAMEGFTRYFNHLANTGRISCFSSGRIVAPSHLLYADDIVIFTRADCRNLLRLKAALSTFGMASGRSLVFEKLMQMLPRLPFQLPLSLCSRHCWSTTHLHVTKAVQEYFIGVPIPQVFGSTTITLLPKKDTCTSFDDYKPISLSTFFSKIITKILSDRLKLLLHKLIPEEQAAYQTAYQTGKGIEEHILLTKEMVHMLASGYRESNIIIKLDLCKAFDTFSWEFLETILSKFGFTQHSLLMLMGVLKGTWFSILVNGLPRGFFPMKSGVKQGDALSPLLFIIALEGLSQEIKHQMNMGFIKPFHTGLIKSPSHLLYADDLIIFTNGESRNLLKIQHILSTFMLTSGQSINLSKSQIIVHPKLSRDRRSLISSITNIKTSSGRYVLIKHVLSAIPMHTLLVQDLPKSVITSLNKMMANFLWGSRETKNKHHWRKWADLCYSLEERGLGFKSIEDLQAAAALQMWWKVQQGGYNLGRNYHPISHLAFADDLILFTNGYGPNLKQVHNFMRNYERRKVTGASMKTAAKSRGDYFKTVLPKYRSGFLEGLLQSLSTLTLGDFLLNLCSRSKGTPPLESIGGPTPRTADYTSPQMLQSIKITGWLVQFYAEEMALSLQREHGRLKKHLPYKTNDSPSLSAAGSSPSSAGPSSSTVDMEDAEENLIRKIFDEEEKIPTKGNSYLLKNADTPRLIITQVKLNGDNDEEWARAMRIAFRAKRKIGFIDGSIPCPEEGDENYEEWWIVNVMLVSWIYNTIASSLRNSITQVEVAVELWKDIQDCFCWEKYHRF